MQFGTRDDPVQRTQANVAIGVLEETVQRVKNVVGGKHLRDHPEQGERQGVESVLDRLLDRMKAADVEPVEPVRRMVHRVKPPHQPELVEGAMQPVAQQIRSGQHQRRLHGYRPGLGPVALHRNAAALQQLGEFDDQRDRQQPRQGALYDEHEHGVGADIGTGRFPFGAIRQPDFMAGDEHRPDDHRRVGRERDRYARPRQGAVQQESERQNGRVGTDRREQPGAINHGSASRSRYAASWRLRVRR